MVKLFYFFLDSESRRAVLQGKLNCPGANYMLYGADQLHQHGFAVQHNLEESAPPGRWVLRIAWLVDRTLRLLGASSGDFQTVLKEWRRCRQTDIVVSTVDNVGVPLVYLNYIGLLRRPLLYISIGLPERIASLKRPWLRAFYRALYRRVPRIATYGWEEAVRLREWLGLPPDSERVVFIPFGVDPLAFSPDPGTPLTTDVLSVGADMQRDFQLLLAVAAQQSSRSFRIITSPRHAKTFGTIPANVTVLTDVPFSEIRSHLAESRVVVLPCHDNTYSSGTTTLLQAMAMGKAVVVTATGATRKGYKLEDNVNCRLVAPGSRDELDSTIRELLDDSVSRQRIGEAAHRTVGSHLTWALYAHRMAAIISATHQSYRAQT